MHFTTGGALYLIVKLVPFSYPSEAHALETREANNDVLACHPVIRSRTNGHEAPLTLIACRAITNSPPCVGRRFVSVLRHDLHRKERFGDVRKDIQIIAWGRERTY